MSSSGEAAPPPPLGATQGPPGPLGFETPPRRLFVLRLRAGQALPGRGCHVKRKKRKDKNPRIREPPRQGARPQGPGGPFPSPSPAGYPDPLLVGRPAGPRSRAAHSLLEGKLNGAQSLVHVVVAPAATFCCGQRPPGEDKLLLDSAFCRGDVLRQLH